MESVGIGGLVFAVVVQSLFLTMYIFMIKASYLDEGHECHSKMWARVFGFLGAISFGIGLLGSLVALGIVIKN